ncbi:unnamed protein product [Nesidiocoris tenuis]|uniref:Uncharacterized protein n=1 Tax=Nesidiocoris tenuis TaxID=355587 RepID=A0A6H5GGW6_9HEMI|nr:unnamed protein product [Nesidiocoris tenuis]
MYRVGFPLIYRSGSRASVNFNFMTTFLEARIRLKLKLNLKLKIQRFTIFSPGKKLMRSSESRVAPEEGSEVIIIAKGLKVCGQKSSHTPRISQENIEGEKFVQVGYRQTTQDQKSPAVYLKLATVGISRTLTLVENRSHGHRLARTVPESVRAEAGINVGAERWPQADICLTLAGGVGMGIGGNEFEGFVDRLHVIEEHRLEDWKPLCATRDSLGRNLPFKEDQNRGQQSHQQDVNTIANYSIHHSACSRTAMYLSCLVLITISTNFCVNVNLHQTHLNPKVGDRLRTFHAGNTNSYICKQYNTGSWEGFERSISNCSSLEQLKFLAGIAYLDREKKTPGRKRENRPECSANVRQQTIENSSNSPAAWTELMKYFTTRQRMLSLCRIQQNCTSQILNVNWNVGLTHRSISTYMIHSMEKNAVAFGRRGPSLNFGLQLLPSRSRHDPRHVTNPVVHTNRGESPVANLLAALPGGCGSALDSVSPR